MGLKVKKKKGASLPLMEAGTYPAVCIAVVDLGEQYNELYKNYRDMVLLIWEIPSQTVTVDGEEKPRWLSRSFTASLNEKSNLSKFLVPWRGKAFSEAELSVDGSGFDLKEMLGQGCFLQVILEEKEDGTKRNNVSAVISLPAEMASPATETEKLVFDMDAWDDAVLEKLPEWIQNKVKKSTQYQKLHTPADEVDFGNPAPTDVSLPNAEEPNKEDCPI